MWNQLDWPALERLRALFLQGTAGHHDYWQSRSDLQSYDQTFAQRIGWKWDYVLADLKNRPWTPPAGAVLDWGCGSGIAGRAFLDCFGAGHSLALQLWDRSAMAMQFAAQRARDKYSGLQVGLSETAPAAPATLLLSHVLTELDEAQLTDLLGLIQRATSVVWVEPGTFEISRRLIRVREALRGQFNVVAPCTHPCVCGMLAPENSPHWCHFFAAPPPQIFADGDWVRFGQMAGVDLRSLPLSYLVLDKRAAPPTAEGSFRVIGRPRVYKPYAQILGCDGSGVVERKLMKRTLPEEYKMIKKADHPSLLVWQAEGEKLLA